MSLKQKKTFFQKKRILAVKTCEKFHSYACGPGEGDGDEKKIVKTTNHHGANKLVHEMFDSCFWEILPSSADQLVDIHVHKFKHKCQSASWLITL